MTKIGNNRVASAQLDKLSDPFTDKRLLPESMWPRDNTRRLRFCRAAMRKAIEICLSSTQKRVLEMHYYGGMQKADIARLQNIGASAVSKSIQSAQKAIREYVAMYMEIYDTLEQELLSEED